MSSRLTLLFLCDQSHLYSDFIEKFGDAGFQVLIARSLVQAKTVLLARAVDFVVLRHDCSRDDRVLAGPLKRIAPGTAIYLFTDQAQARPDDIDLIWRAEVGDEDATRAMAMLLRSLLQPRQASRAAAVLTGIDSLFVGARADG
jgi:hypothetical protein